MQSNPITMKNNLRILSLTVIISLFPFFSSCFKAEKPTIKTADISLITKNSATSGGTIIKDGGSEISIRGVCWSSKENPTISDSKTTDGTGLGTYVSNLTGLNYNTTYYVRAYATNSAGTGYGEAKSFTTPDCMYCRTVTYDNGVVVNTSNADLVCGDDLKSELARPPITVASITAKRECSRVP